MFRMRSTADFSQYPKASCLSKRRFHYQSLYFKDYNLTFSGISKILSTVTITKISFSVLRNTYNKFFFHDSNSFKQSYLFITYNIIRTIQWNNQNKISVKNGFAFLQRLLLSCNFFYFSSNIFAFLQYSFKYFLLSFKNVFYCFPSDIFIAFLQIYIFCFPSNIFLLSCIFFFLLSFKYFCFPSIFIQIFFDFPSNTFYCFLSNIFYCFPSNIFVFLQILLLSFIYFCFPSNIFTFLHIFLFSFKGLIALFIYFTLQQSFKFLS